MEAIDGIEVEVEVNAEGSMLLDVHAELMTAEMLNPKTMVSCTSNSDC
jgi:hypothetical protein